MKGFVSGVPSGGGFMTLSACLNDAVPCVSLVSEGSRFVSSRILDQQWAHPFDILGPDTMCIRR